MDLKSTAIKKHKEWKGKIEVISRTPITNREELAIAYTPGVAEPCIAIKEDESKAYDYTRKGNMVAVITDGTAVLGLGDIGPSAGMPVMEGKCALFKEFADVDAFPICIDSKDTDEIVKTIALISKSFGGINLEDISSPRCFEIEDRLREMEEVDIPVFHDDQHGTAITLSAALINSLRVVDKKMDEISVVLCGPGAAGTAICKMILSLGVKDLIVVDKDGIIYEGKPGITGHIKWLSENTNKEKIQGTLADALVGRDVFIGVSAPNIVTEDMVKTMNKEPIFFAMANPVPEIDPDLAKRAGAAIVGTGRSDYPNQINNVLVFPGMFKGVLAVRANDITESMKIAAANAVADFVPADKLCKDYILPAAFEEGVANAVANAVAKEAVRLGINRIPYEEIV